MMKLAYGRTTGQPVFGSKEWNSFLFSRDSRPALGPSELFVQLTLAAIWPGGSMAGQCN